MTNLNRLGVHVFEKTKDIPYEKEVLGMNLLSCLTWKFFCGPIIIYCNSEYKKLLVETGIDKLYDEINTDVLDNKPLDIDYSKYWAFSKLLVIEHLQNSTPFTLFDNDLWFTGPIEFNDHVDLIAYHFEKFDLDYKYNIYVDFDQMVPEDVKKLNFDKKVLPTNAAILHFNTKYFIQEWIDLSKKIAKFNNNIEFDHKSTQMCFVEQRLLPMLLTKRGFTYSTFMDHVYLTHLSQAQDGTEWYPNLDDSDEESLDKFRKIKHVWGLKRSFNIPHIKSLVLENMVLTLRNFNFRNTPYQSLYDYLVEELNSIQKATS